MINNEIFTREIQHEHERLVSRISGLLARKAHFTNDETMLVESGAILHDLGKQFLRNGLLSKPSKLTEHEYKIVQSHIFYGSEYILQSIKTLLAAYIISLQHHEKVSGNGYANVTNIHKYAKIVAVADVFDSLLAKRPYKKAWNPENALEYMRENSKKQFEAEYITALIESIDEILQLYHSNQNIKGA
jgi:HD-GYP domain-containing protein (c-di-GMP phosphodiesterase class II)